MTEKNQQILLARRPSTCDWLVRSGASLPNRRRSTPTTWSALNMPTACARSAVS